MRYVGFFRSAIVLRRRARAGVRTLDPGQVAGCEAILAEGERRQLSDTRGLAYILATAFWETARSMQPVREIGRGRGKPYGTADPNTHQTYYGRGFVQLTWKANYAAMGKVCGLDLVAAPDHALQPEVAIAILFEGMQRGLFTGRKLADFFGAGEADWVGARRIINGQDRAETIAGYARCFDAALQKASVAAHAEPPAPAGLAARFKSFFRLAPRS